VWYFGAGQPAAIGRTKQVVLETHRRVSARQIQAPSPCGTKAGAKQSGRVASVCFGHGDFLTLKV
jgi:hypothetical protein